ncbi:MAG TPA: hypothetical protein VGR26_06620, partial [Acidimicrobiales bacterium]|nr:hypothetical protein [Acidimicrobiales bacterium]
STFTAERQSPRCSSSTSPGGALDQGATRLAENEVALPVAGQAPSATFGGPFGDVDLPRIRPRTACRAR